MFFLVKILTALLVVFAVTEGGVPAQAAMTRFDFGKVTFSLDVPVSGTEAWESARNLFGIPLTLLGPEKAGGRPVLQVTPTDKFSLPLDRKNKQANERAYHEGRQQWVKKRGGEVLSFSSLKEEVWSPQVKAVLVGVRYRLNGVEYIEQSVFVTCKNKLFHLKSLLRAAHEKEFANSVEKMMRSISCEIF